MVAMAHTWLLLWLEMRQIWLLLYDGDETLYSEMIENVHGNLVISSETHDMHVSSLGALKWQFQHSSICITVFYMPHG